jgi:D-alanyl-D-alanine-carboxypeptidase/D-alanyl-D-alanine-endopeptidase
MDPECTIKMSTKPLCLMLSAVFSIVAASPSHAFTQTEVDHAVRQISNAAMKPAASDKHPVALVIGVVTRDGIQKTYGYGATQFGGSVTPDGDTLFEVASVTKTFTATLLAQELIDGKIQLDDPINQAPCNASSVSAFCYHGTSSTFLDLATHTASFPDAPGLPGYALDTYSRADIDNYLAGYTLKKTPGTAYKYSNLGFGYLADLLSDREGKTFNDMISEKITRVLGLNNTAVLLSEDQQARMNPGYRAGYNSGPDFETERLYRFSDSSGLAGAAAIHSTANDLLKYLSAEIGVTSTPLSAAMQLSQTKEFSHAPSTAALAVALGWEILDASNIIFHSGALPGFDSFIGFNLDSGLGVVVLTNTSFYIRGVGYDQSTDLGIQLLFNLMGVSSDSYENLFGNPAGTPSGHGPYNDPNNATESILPFGGV